MTLLPPSGPAVFTDVTESSRITWSHHSGSAAKHRIQEQIGSGLALFDYDGDGWLDIYLLSGLDASGRGGNALYRNNRDGTFSDVTVAAGLDFAGWSMGVCAGDVNGDGRVDLYVTNLGPNLLYTNNGDGTFREAAQRAGVACPYFSTGAAFADYDRDGDLDLFVANYVEPEAEERLCDYYGLRVACGPRGLKGAPDFLYRNRGDGTFEDVSRSAGVSDEKLYYGLGVIWSDLDDDGDQDLFVANDRTPNYLYVNRLEQGRAGFDEQGLPRGVAVGADGEVQACMGVDAADYDQDGHLDLIVTNFSREHNALYRGQGGGFFSDAVRAAGLGIPSFPWVGWGTRFFDLECDGDLDLLVANGHTYPQVDGRQWEERYHQRSQLFLNSGEGRFRELPDQLAGRAASSRGVAVGDLDNDGDLDAVISNVGAPPTLLRNDSPRRGQWMMVKLRGRPPNSLALGARVRCEASGRVQIQEVRSGGSYLSQHDLRLHFGLGEAGQVDRLVVRWPGGREQIWTDLAAGRVWTLQEE